MDPVNIIEGAVSDLPRDDVDTDQIIPARFMKRVERTGFGEYLFFDAKQTPGWSTEVGNPILTAGANFGSGSSREHAPWALEDAGFRAVVAVSIADIFYSNSTKVGLLPVQLPEDQVRKVAAAGDAKIDLEHQTVTAAGESFSFDIDQDTKYRLLNGLDDIGLTLRQVERVDAFERGHDSRGWKGPSSLDLPPEPVATTPVG